MEKLITDSVTEALKKRSFNNVGEVVKLLKDLGLEPSLTDSDRSELAAMMARRHLIAHRADWNERIGQGHHHVVPLGKSTVESWISTTERFGILVLATL